MVNRKLPPPEVKSSQRFLIARNWYKRPTLQHVIITFDVTACGMPVTTWPYRSYGGRPLEALLCMKCAKNQGIKLPDLEDLASSPNGSTSAVKRNRTQASRNSSGVAGRVRKGDKK